MATLVASAVQSAAASRVQAALPSANQAIDAIGLTGFHYINGAILIGKVLIFAFVLFKTISKEIASIHRSVQKEE
jgi:hypothetical protein